MVNSLEGQARRLIRVLRASLGRPVPQFPQKYPAGGRPRAGFRFAGQYPGVRCIAGAGTGRTGSAAGCPGRRRSGKDRAICDRRISGQPPFGLSLATATSLERAAARQGRRTGSFACWLNERTTGGTAGPTLVTGKTAKFPSWSTIRSGGHTRTRDFRHQGPESPKDPCRPRRSRTDQMDARKELSQRVRMPRRSETRPPRAETDPRCSISLRGRWSQQPEAGQRAPRPLPAAPGGGAPRLRPAVALFSISSSLSPGFKMH